MMSNDAFDNIVGRLRRPVSVIGWMLILWGIAFITSSGFRLNPLTNLSIVVFRRCLFLVFPFGISLSFLSTIRGIEKAGGLDAEKAEALEGWLALLVLAAYTVILNQW